MNLKIDVIMIIAAFLIGYVLSYIIKYKLIEGQRVIKATDRHVKGRWTVHTESKWQDPGVVEDYNNHVGHKYEIGIR
jgi:hypothetical protein